MCRILQPSFQKSWNAVQKANKKKMQRCITPINTHKQNSIYVLLHVGLQSNYAWTLKLLWTTLIDSLLYSKTHKPYQFYKLDGQATPKYGSSNCDGWGRKTETWPLIWNCVFIAQPSSNSEAEANITQYHKRDPLVFSDHLENNELCVHFILYIIIYSCYLKTNKHVRKMQK